MRQKRIYREFAEQRTLGGLMKINILQGWRTRIRERRVEERILLGWRTRIREESRRQNITRMEN